MSPLVIVALFALGAEDPAVAPAPAPAPAPAEATSETPVAAPVEAAPGEAAKPADVVASAPAASDFESSKDCARWRARGLYEGPVSVGYNEADIATGRRVCPRTEIGLGGRFGAIIDTPDFYGVVAAQGVIFGSYALRDTTELFGTLEFFSFTFAQNAVPTSTQMTLGDATVGATQILYRGDEVLLGVSLRVLLPTSFAVPGSRVFGAELGGTASWRPLRWFEGHAYLGSDFSLGLSRAASLPRGGATLIAGVQLSPFDWFALVVDVNGRIGPLNYLAPSVGLRFKISDLGIELGATLPVLGTDRHDVIGGLRVSWRI